MITLNLSRARTARVWLGDLPPATYEADGIIKTVIEARAAAFSSTRVVVVEMKQHRGGRMLYGLVRGEFSPSNSSQLNVSVHTSAGADLPFPSSLMTWTDP